MLYYSFQGGTFKTCKEEQLKKSLEKKMLGLGDGYVAAAIIGNVIITVACIVFGALNWNSGSGDEKK